MKAKKFDDQLKILLKTKKPKIMKHTNTVSNKELAEKEIREYSDQEIIWTDTGFPKNHLMCNRGKYCDFVQQSKYVIAYLFPEANTVKEGNAFTEGNWMMQKYSPCDYGIYSDAGNGNDIAIVRSRGNEEAEANARLIAESKNLFKIVGELIQYLEWREDFLIEDSEEGETNVYTQAKAIINRINNQ